MNNNTRTQSDLDTMLANLRTNVPYYFLFNN